MYRSIFGLFSRYVSISLLNTVVHWSVFFFLLYGATLNQAWSNFIAYMFALTFSFYANARFTFKAKISKRRYVSFVSFMAVLSVVMGNIADEMALAPLVTMVVFSFISLVIGFSYSHLIVYRER
ncbi:Bactoprenol-linked glucose translocase homolog from prophage CPS-53 [Oligella ureolytica]|uniref:Bactoprenol-linked glucose translocase homolog from prophage CPS-53 n=1 Tax=Oligella ureolytica TaxID=90244 RepID=A0A378XDU0_9BURK|nr:GtrA family protein [Oligella ureolytica]SUA51047.1 Bactoprenol-linked glucose translocase homolog from prophage CPS-53 [Oligella ureolytica]SUA59061.1 Bactoprenol-linked glucose translocase homolog from prophage CPS-53 [Oligella ureolytica]